MHNESPVNSNASREAHEPIGLGTVGMIGSGLVRPECVLATASGDLYSADWRGGVAHIAPDGSQNLFMAQAIDGEVLKPNGIALQADGSFLLAHLGSDLGGVYQLERNGNTKPFLQAVQGVDLPPTNFVVGDAQGRTWITVSTRLTPRALGYSRSCNDGFIVLVDASGARIVVDGLGYANECAIDPTGQWLFVNETFSRRLTRFRIAPNGDLGAKEVVCEFGSGVFPDGVAFDVEGSAWVSSIVSNRLIRVAPDGRQTVWLEESDATHLAWVEAAFEANEMGRPHLDGTPSKVLRNLSSLAFGGPDLRTGYLGCLLGDGIGMVNMPIQGHPPFHWLVKGSI